MPLLRFISLYQTRVWGGRVLEEKFGRQIPAGDIGESWELCDRPQAQSVVAEGEYAGLTLRQLIEKHGREILSPDYECSRPFPILIKWLDARERLSLQVHPPANIAEQLGGEHKTECWYIADAASNAGVFAGLKKGATRQQFEAALKHNKLEPLIHRHHTHKGDFIFIPSGRLHAIDAGNLILEIQQNSDTTYRVYDWGRPRELRVAQALACINFRDFEPALTPASSQPKAILDQNPLFTVTRYSIKPNANFGIPASPTAQILTVAEGNLGGYKAGQNLLIPCNTPVKLIALQPTTLILTSNFL